MNNVMIEIYNDQKGSDIALLFYFSKHIYILNWVFIEILN